MRARLLVCCALLIGHAAAAEGQAVSQRGFVEGAGFAFPQEAPNDTTQAVGDLLVREELFVTPVRWIRFAAGLEGRANTHDQVDSSWAVDFSDRGELRPRLSVRRLSATMTHGPLTVDVGKQFMRWGKTDILNPTDRFAPRDFMNVVDADFLGITAIHGTAQAGNHTFEAVWAPRFTPSRSPLIDQRWAVIPPQATGIPIVEEPSNLPGRSQYGVRWGHVAGGFEYSLSFFDGFNHLPDIDAVVQYASPAVPVPTAIAITRIYPPIRTYGGDLAWPLRWFTIKAEATYFSSPSQTTDEYGLYVVQLERQVGEWLFVAGYAGEADSRLRAQVTFAPDRGMSRSIVGRVSHTIDTNRSVAFEGAVHQNGHGAYGKGEYSQARGQHWRGTVTVVVLGGQSDDFFGQYDHNSHVKLTARYSF
jgi:hypothetical protein